MIPVLVLGLLFFIVFFTLAELIRRIDDLLNAITDHITDHDKETS